MQRQYLNPIDLYLKQLTEELEKLGLHNSLKKRMLALEYKVENGGLCVGLAGMGMQNWLLSRLEGVEKLIKRCRLTLEMHESELKKVVTSNQEKSPSLEYKEQRYTLFPNPTIYPERAETSRDTISLFDGINGYQKDRLLTQSINKTGWQSPLNAAPIVLSKELQEKGNLVLLHSFMDAYQQSDLIDCLYKLKEVQIKYPAQTLAFRLCSSNHTILVGYDITHNIWILIDANNLYEFIFDNDHVAEQIINALSPNKATDFKEICILQEKLKTDLKDLYDKLKLHFVSLTIPVNHFNIKYDVQNNHFILSNPKYKQCAIFRIQTYAISSIQKELEIYLTSLVLKFEKSRKESFLSVQLYHLTHKIKIQYRRINNSWVLLDEDNDICGTTQEKEEISQVAQIAQWVMSEFLTSNNISVLQMDVTSSLDDQQSHCIRDQNIDMLINEFDRNFGISVLKMSKEKALSCDAYDATLLHSAASDGRMDIASFLIEHGADVNKMNYRGLTPLYTAAQMGWENIVDLLLKNHAKDIFGHSAFFVAALNGHTNVIDIFIQHGICTNEQKDETTPIVAASQNGHLEMVVKLFSCGARNTADDRNITPLFTAADNGHFEVVKYLLSRSDTVIDNTNNSGFTALHAAAMNGYRNIVAILIAHGSDSITGSRAKKPQYYAEKNGHTEIIYLLLDGERKKYLVKLQENKIALLQCKENLSLLEESKKTTSDQIETLQDKCNEEKATQKKITTLTLTTTIFSTIAITVAFFTLPAFFIPAIIVGSSLSLFTWTLKLTHKRKIQKTIDSSEINIPQLNLKIQQLEGYILNIIKRQKGLINYINYFSKKTQRD